MLPKQRLACIANTIKQQKYCSVQQLADEVHVSNATIRRDLQLLANQDIIQLTRGGAMHKSANASAEPDYMVKSSLNREEKKRIGAAACAMIRLGETILLDTGTTVYQMTQSLQQMENLTIVTNDVRIVAELAVCPALTLCILGGIIRKGHYTTTGVWAQSALENLHVDRVFLSCDAVDLNMGCSITNSEEILIKQSMIKAGDSCVLLVDHSKFESMAFMRLCNLDKINCIITGKELDDRIVQEYRAAGIKIMLV